MRGAYTSRAWSVNRDSGGPRARAPDELAGGWSCVSRGVAAHTGQLACPMDAIRSMGH
jgi:hypothetical protein